MAAEVDIKVEKPEESKTSSAELEKLKRELSELQNALNQGGQSGGALEQQFNAKASELERLKKMIEETKNAPGLNNDFEKLKKDGEAERARRLAELEKLRHQAQEEKNRIMQDLERAKQQAEQGRV